MSGGRPTLYDPAYCEQVIELGREGKSIRQISAAIDVPRRTMDHWAENNEEFRAALKRAEELSAAWWENAAQDGTAISTIGAPIWARMVASRWPSLYVPVERREVTGKDGGPVEINSLSREELAAQVEAKLAALGLSGTGGEDDG